MVKLISKIFEFFKNTDYLESFRIILITENDANGICKILVTNAPKTVKSVTKIQKLSLSLFVAGICHRHVGSFCLARENF